MKKIIPVLLLFWASTTFSQVKIGDNINTIDEASILELESASKVFVVTRLTTDQMNAITPINGALTYNTDANCLYQYRNNNWESLCVDITGGQTITAIIDNLDGTFSYINESDTEVIISKANLVDNEDGTYTFSNKSSENITIDTNASAIPYDNTTSTLEAENVQTAIDELKESASIDDDITAVTFSGVNLKIDEGTTSFSADLSPLEESAAIAAEETRALAAEALKEDTINKSTNTTLGTSDVLFPTQNAVKTYVDNQVGTLNTLANGTIYVGDASNNAQEVSISGDATLNNTGVLTIENDAITANKIGTSGAADANMVLGTNAAGDPEWQNPAASLGENVSSTNGSITGVANDAALVAMDLEVKVDDASIEVNATNGVQVKDDGITTDKIINNAITTPKIADANVSTAKLADNAVTTDKIGTAGGADANKILGTSASGDPEWQNPATSLGENVSSTNGSITGVANDAALVAMDLEVKVDDASIEVNATNGVQVKDDGITTDKIINNAITTDKITDANVTTAKLADNAVTTDKIGTAGGADANKILGTSATGDPEWQSPTDALGENVTSTNGSITGIANDASLVAMDLEVKVDDASIEVNATNGVQVKDDGITTDKIINNAITTDKITDANVTTAKLADNAVTTDKIGTAGGTDANKILGTSATGDPEWQNPAASLGENVSSTNGSITGVANDAALVAMDLEVKVDDASIEVNATNGVQVKDDGITTNKIINNAITTDKITDANVTTAKLADNAVTTDKIGTAGATDANKILGTSATGDPEWQSPTDALGENVTSTNGSITGIANDASLVAMDLEVKVDDASIEVNATNGVQVKDDGITTNKIINNAITTDKITDANVTTAKLADNAITTVKINNDAVTTDKIGTAGTADANKILGTSTAGNPEWQNPITTLGKNVTSSNGSITGVANDATLVAMDLEVKVDDNSIEVDAATGVQVKNDGITTDKIINNAITTTKITDLNVTTAKLADKAVITAKINDNAVTTDQIGTAGTSDANKILGTNAGGDPEWQNPSTALGKNVTSSNGSITGIEDSATLVAMDLEVKVDDSSIEVDATNGVQVKDNGITTDKIINNAITTAKITDANVTTAKLADDAITADKINADIAGSGLSQNATTGALEVDALAVSDLVDGHKIATITETNGTVVEIDETITSLEALTGSTLRYTNEEGGFNDIPNITRSVNGVQPAANGNVAVMLSSVSTGLESARPVTADEADIYIVSGESGITADRNGIAFIYDDPTGWQEVTTDLSTLDARYLNVNADAMLGVLSMGNNNITNLSDPANAQDAATKNYVDTQIMAAADDDISAVSFDGTSLKVDEGATSFSADLSALEESAAIAAEETRALAAEALKEDTANKSTNTSLGASDVLFPTQNAVKTYVDAQIIANIDDDVTAVTFDGTNLKVDEGTTTFSADLSSLEESAAITAEETRALAAEALKEDTANKSTTVTLGTSDELFPTQNAVKTYVDNQVGTLNTLANGTIYVGDASNNAQEVSISGDATLDNTGVLTIENDAITANKIGTSGAADANMILGTNAAGDPEWQNPATSLGENVSSTNGSITGIANNAALVAMDLEVKVDDASIEVNATNGVQVKDDGITTDKIINNAITTDKITDANVTTAKLADNAVTTDKIGTAGATDADKILGTSATGDPEWQSPTDALGENVTSTNGSITGIANDAALVAMDLEVKVDDASIEVNATNGVQVKDDGITTNKIINNAITTDKITDANVTTAKLADNAVTTDKIGTAGGADANKILGTSATGDPEWQSPTDALGENVTSTNGSITGIANDAALVAMDLEVKVDDASIEVNATNGVQVKDDGITTNKIINNAITTDKITDANVTTAKLADNAVTTDKIGTAGGADANKILGTSASGDPEWQSPTDALGENVTSTNGSITGIANDAALVAMDLEVKVDDASIEVNATNGVQVKDDGITTNKIINNAITTDKITDANVTTAKLADNAVTTDKIGTAGGADANKILGTSATGDPEWQTPTDALGENVTSTNGSITGIANDAALVAMDLEVKVDDASIEVNATNGVQVKDDGITTDKIINNAITTAKITDANVTTAKLADNAVTTVKINNDAVTTDKIGTAGGADANKILGTTASGDPEWQNPSAALGQNVTSSNGSITGVANDATLVAMNLEVKVDDNSIEVDDSNGVQVKNSGITTPKIANLNVTTEKIADNAITTDKIGTAGITEGNKILGTNAAGDPEWQTPASETVTTLTQNTTTGAITYTNETPTTQTANVVGAETNNSITVGANGGAFYVSPIKAFGKISGTGAITKATPGIAVTKISTGYYRVNLPAGTTVDANYIIQLTQPGRGGAGNDDPGISYNNQTATSFEVIIGDNDNGTTDRSRFDSEFMFTIIDL